MLQKVRPTKTTNLNFSFYRGIVSFSPLHNKIWLSRFIAYPHHRDLKKAIAEVRSDVCFNLGFNVSGVRKEPFMWSGMPFQSFLDQGPIFALTTSLALGWQQSPAPTISFEREEAVNQMADVVLASHQSLPYLLFILDDEKGKRRVDMFLLENLKGLNNAQQIKKKIRAHLFYARAGTDFGFRIAIGLLISDKDRRTS